ncbi:MAG: hypothetical protein KDB27_27520 [Planctomycetales bacterium]|nr:hypothetical protein [Planctomycetales bacterium]
MTNPKLLAVGLTLFGATVIDAAPLNRPCGPNSVPLLNLIIPQGAAGADFRPACRHHDACYAKCSGKSKQQCDCEFLHGMLKACECSRNPKRCRRRAKIMYRAVDRFGDAAYGY